MTLGHSAKGDTPLVRFTLQRHPCEMPSAPPHQDTPAPHGRGAFAYSLRDERVWEFLCLLR